MSCFTETGDLVLPSVEPGDLETIPPSFESAFLCGPGLVRVRWRDKSYTIDAPPCINGETCVGATLAFERFRANRTPPGTLAAFVPPREIGSASVAQAPCVLCNRLAVSKMAALIAFEDIAFPRTLAITATAARMDGTPDSYVPAACLIPNAVRWRGITRPCVEFNLDDYTVDVSFDLAQLRGARDGAEWVIRQDAIVQGDKPAEHLTQTDFR